jgi:hypothetical protein
MSSVLMLLGWAVATTPFAQSQPTQGDEGAKTVTVTYRVPLDGRTPAEARQQALNGARAEAVRQVVGAQVQAERSYARSATESDTDAAVVERFAQVVRTGASGRVVEEAVLASGIVSEGASGSRRSVYHVRLRATVRPDVGRPDPSFRAILDLTDEDGVFVARTPPEASDALIATLRVTQDAHLTLFSITRDTVEVLWPNALMPEATARADVPVEFPPPDWRARGMRLHVDLPPRVHRRSARRRAGTRRSKTGHVTERLLLVATKRRIPFRPIPDVSLTGTALTTVEASLHALNRWLVTIPLDQRATATATYDVRAARP